MPNMKDIPNGHFVLRIADLKEYCRGDNFVSGKTAEVLVGLAHMCAVGAMKAKRSDLDGIFIEKSNTVYPWLMMMLETERAIMELDKEPKEPTEADMADMKSQLDEILANIGGKK